MPACHPDTNRIGRMGQMGLHGFMDSFSITLHATNPLGAASRVPFRRAAPPTAPPAPSLPTLTEDASSHTKSLLGDLNQDSDSIPPPQPCSHSDKLRAAVTASSPPSPWPDGDDEA